MDVTQIQSENNSRPQTGVKKKVDVKFMTELALLTAVLLIMAYTPLGYFYIGVMPITLLVVPVAVGSVVLGAKAGAFLGFVFGLTSILQPTGITLLAIVPLQGLATAIIPRIFVGLVPAWAYKGLLKVVKKRSIATSVACLLAPITNTVLYLSFFVLCLGSYMAETNPDVYGFIANNNFFVNFGLVLASVGVNAVVEAFACLVIAAAVCNALIHTVNK